MARILILTIYHDPEPIPKTGELARDLQARGHDVTVVTAFPHYPSGELYPGYRLAPWRWENRDGVRVLRTCIYPYHGARSILRMLNYVSWMLSSIQAAWLAPKCDVMYVWHPPLTVGVSAWIISRLKGVPYVYDVQDLWPESALASGLVREGALVRFMYRLARWVYARAPRILVVSDAAARYLEERGVPPAKVAVARHWLDPTPFDLPATRPNVREDLGWADRFVVLFAGNLGMVQGLETVVAAASLLRHRADILFCLVGDGSDRARVEELVRTGGLANVQFAGRYPQADMPSFMRAADALLVHLRRSDIADHAIPTKVLSYLAAGRPVVCATGGAAASLIEDAAAGVTPPPGDPAALAAAIERLAVLPARDREAMGKRGRAYLDRHFTRTAVIREYERLILETASGPSAAHSMEGAM